MVNNYVGFYLAAVVLILCVPLAVNASGAKHCYKASKPINFPLDPNCKLIEKNLNEFCDVPPNACGFPIHSRYGARIKEVSWAPVDIAEEKIFYSIKNLWAPFSYNSIMNEYTAAIWGEEETRILPAITEKRIMLYRAKLDVFGGGEPVDVYTYEIDDCMEIQSRLDGFANWRWYTVQTPKKPILFDLSELKARKELESSPNGEIGNGQLFSVDGVFYVYYVSGYIPKYHRIHIDIKRVKLPPANGRFFGKTVDACRISYVLPENN
jgi:hypothetical protein